MRHKQKLLGPVPPPLSGLGMLRSANQLLSSGPQPAEETKTSPTIPIDSETFAIDGREVGKEEYLEYEKTHDIIKS